MHRLAMHRTATRRPATARPEIPGGLPRAARPRSRRADAALLVADPWSWNESPALPTAWLGGCASGANAGSSLVNLEALLTGGMIPPWRVAGAGRIDWTLRNHRNHFELIRSDYLLACR